MKEEESKNLMEQRAIYGDLKRQKFEELEELKNAMYFIQTGSICCEGIYPTTNIRIERQLLRSILCESNSQKAR